MQGMRDAHEKGRVRETAMSGIRWIETFSAVVLAASGLAATSAAELRIRITDPNFEPVPIAVSEFVAEREDDRIQGQRLVEVMVSNLRNSGVFKPLDSRSFIQKPEELVRAPRMADWKQIGAEAVVGGRVSTAGGIVKVELRGWYVSTGTTLVGRVFETSAPNWRRLAHKMSDRIFESVTGETGYFDTRVVYVA